MQECSDPLSTLLSPHPSAEASTQQPRSCVSTFPTYTEATTRLRQPVELGQSQDTAGRSPASNAHCLPGAEQVGQEVEEGEEDQFWICSSTQPGERSQAASGSEVAATWGRASPGRPSGARAAK